MDNEVPTNVVPTNDDNSGANSEAAVPTRQERLGTMRTQGEPKKAKAMKIPPTEAIIPWLWSVSGIRYHVWRRLRNDLDQVPPVGWRQRPHSEVELLEKEITFYAANVHITVVFVNKVGGAGKSFTAAMVGQIWAQITGRHPLLMPSTTATDTSTTAMYAGISAEKALTISRFYRLVERPVAPDVLKNLIPRTPFGMGVITEDPDGEIGDAASSIEINMWRKSTDVAKKMSDLLLLDLGNDSIDDDSIVLEAARQADVICFVGNPDKQITLEKIAANIHRYQTDLRGEGVTDLRVGSRRTGSQISTQEKTANSIVLISGVAKGQGPADYAEYTMRRGDKGSISSIGFDGVILTIPFLRSLKNKKRRDRRNIVADPTKLTLAERRAYLELIREICVTAAELQGFPYRFDPANSDPIARILAKTDDELVGYYDLASTRVKTHMSASIQEPGHSTTVLHSPTRPVDTCRQNIEGE